MNAGVAAFFSYQQAAAVHEHAALQAMEPNQS